MIVGQAEFRAAVLRIFEVDGNAISSNLLRDCGNLAEVVRAAVRSGECGVEVDETLWLLARLTRFAAALEDGGELSFARAEAGRVRGEHHDWRKEDTETTKGAA